jgi:hypothetical protein
MTNSPAGSVEREILDVERDEFRAPQRSGRNQSSSSVRSRLAPSVDASIGSSSR